MAQIRKALSEGETPRQLVERGFSRSTVYKVRRQLEKAEKAQDPMRQLLEEATLADRMKQDTCLYAQKGRCQYLGEEIPVRPFFCLFCVFYEAEE